MLATQNPIESEGVYPLPEAQRDRFLMRIPVDYPTPAEEHEIVARSSRPAAEPDRLLSLDDVARAAGGRGRGHVDPAVQDYAVRLVLATRDPTAARPGRHRRAPRLRRQPPGQHRPRPRRPGPGPAPGPRPTSLPQDVYDVAFDVLNHRLVLSFDAVADGVTVDDVLVASCSPR